MDGDSNQQPVTSNQQPVISDQGQIQQQQTQVSGQSPQQQQQVVSSQQTTNAPQSAQIAQPQQPSYVKATEGQAIQKQLQQQPQQLQGQSVLSSQQPTSQSSTQPVQDQQVVTAPTTGMGEKEKEPLGRTENVPLVELHKDHEIEPEVEGWLEKVKQGHEIDLPGPVEHEGEVLVADASAQVVDERLVLPMTQMGVGQGMKQKVNTGARWLSEWCMRLIKMFGDQVQYKQSQPKTN